MKKLPVLLFSALLLSSLCFAEEAPVTAPGDHEKVVENKKQDIAKKPVTSKIKKSGKKVKKNKQINKK